MADPPTDIGYIRYDEIQGFDIYVEKRKSSSNKGVSSTHYYYHVLVKKKDGGEWFITEDGLQSKAEEIKNQLINLVKLDQPFKASISTKLSPKIGKQEGADKTVIHWQNKVAWWSPFF